MKKGILLLFTITLLFANTLLALSSMNAPGDGYIFSYLKVVQNVIGPDAPTCNISIHSKKTNPTWHCKSAILKLNFQYSKINRKFINFATPYRFTLSPFSVDYPTNTFFHSKNRKS